MEAIYKTTVSASGGRDGKVNSEDGLIAFEVRIPKEMGGAGGHYTNPEQLFAAAYSACFDSAVNYVAKLQKIRIQSKTTATVGIQSSETEGLNIVVDLDVEINGVEREIALELLQKAHQVCPYSKATRNNVVVTLNLL